MERNNLGERTFPLRDPSFPKFRKISGFGKGGIMKNTTCARLSAALAAEGQPRFLFRLRMEAEEELMDFAEVIADLHEENRRRRLQGRWIAALREDIRGREGKKFLPLL